MVIYIGDEFEQEIGVKEAKSFVGHRPEFQANKTIVTGYNKPTYPVLVGDFVRVYTTKDFASLPHRDTFMVKERIKDDFGVVKAKLTLKCSATIRYVGIYMSTHKLL